MSFVFRATLNYIVIALSGNWRYQRHSHTWSRIGNEQMYGVPGRTVCTKPNWDSSRDPLDPRRYDVREVRDPYAGKRSDRQLERYDDRPDCNGNAAHNKLQRSHSERIKERARAIMKKMDLRSSSRRRKDSRQRDPSAIVIGDPVLVSYDSASPEAMRMIPRPNHLDARGRVAGGSNNALGPSGATRSKSARRQGVVMLSPSSPDSSDDSFLSSNHRRQPRDRSVPPQFIDTDFEYAPQERLRREQRVPYESYLYPSSPGNMSRNVAPPRSSNRRGLQQQALAVGYDAGGVSMFYGSGGYSSSPAYSSPYSTRSYQSPPIVSRNLISESSLDNTDEEQSSGTTTINNNRRDSGVGSSLSRSPSCSSDEAFFTDVQLARCVDSLSVFELARLNKLAYLRVTAILEKHMGPGSTVKIGGLFNVSFSCSSDEAFFTDVQLARCVDSLSVFELARLNKLAYLRVTAILEKHMGPGSTVKIGDHSSTLDDQTGVRFQVLRYLRQMAADTVGIFRKNGVKSRIMDVRAICDRDAECDVFVDENRLDPGQVHDVADTLKQYLRELPEPLMTVRLSETFANIFIHVPDNERLLALQYAILLLPDENREALQTLLLFLSDVSKHAENNSVRVAKCFWVSLNS
ncbi:unnamed protein product [Nippostrongylus brasiliensis]|uniref:Rho-GAP domain-containing protein n=1 Tax=Nippostrongylus brasiliensis TaxID=27835 RepID=A0A158R1J7_NIPBR|nr:unnamed protein product [Nippostrongylus brasiliensis]